MESSAHVKKGRKELAKEVHRFAHLGVRVFDSRESGVAVMNKAKSSLSSKVKEKTR